MARREPVPIEEHRQACNAVAWLAVEDARRGQTQVRVPIGPGPDDFQNVIVLDLREVFAIRVEDGRHLVAYWSAWKAADDLLRRIRPVVGG